MLKQTTPPQKVFLVTIVVLLFLGYHIVLSISRIGETKVAITVIPGDAAVTINTKPASAGNVYLKPGKYLFAASKSGWKTYTQTATVAKTSLKISLLPAPDSDEATSWLKDNPDIQLDREKLGGENAAAQSSEVSQKNPLINQLPYTSLVGPFSIDYGPSKTRKDGVVIIISNSTPIGRQNALTWIKQQGQDPTNLEIQYAGFFNSLVPRPRGD